MLNGFLAKTLTGLVGISAMHGTRSCVESITFYEFPIQYSNSFGELAGCQAYEQVPIIRASTDRTNDDGFECLTIDTKTWEATFRSRQTTRKVDFDCIWHKTIVQILNQISKSTFVSFRNN